MDDDTAQAARPKVGSPDVVLRRLGLAPEDTQTLELSLERVTTDYTPCALIMRSGKAMALLDREGDNWIVLGSDGPMTLPITRLVGHYGGQIMTAARSATTAAPSPPSAPAGQPTRAAPAPPRGQQPALVPEAEPAILRLPLWRSIAVDILVTKPGLLLMMALAALVSNVFGFALPLYSMAIYDRVIPHAAMETLWTLTIGIGLVLLMDTITRMVRNRMQEAIGLTVGLRHQQALFALVTRARLKDVPRHSGAVSGAVGAIEGLAHLLPQLLIGVLIDIPFVILTLIYVAQIGGAVVWAPITAIGLITVMAVIGHIRARKATQISAQINTQRQSLLDQTLLALDTVKALNAGKRLEAAWAKMVDVGSFHGYRARHAGVWTQNIAMIAGQATTVGVLVIGVMLVREGQMTMGAMIAISMLVGRTIAPVNQVVSGLMRIFNLVEGAKGAEALMAAQPEDAGFAAPSPKSVLKGGITFSNVTFSYPGAAAPSLR